MDLNEIQRSERHLSSVQLKSVTSCIIRLALAMLRVAIHSIVAMKWSLSSRMTMCNEFGFLSNIYIYKIDKRKISHVLKQIYVCVEYMAHKSGNEYMKMNNG